MALSQIIVTSRYLKSGTKKNISKRRNYTKYVATRETVEVRDKNVIDKDNNATKNQQELLRDLLLDFPESKRYLEYEDYAANPTLENTSELISIIIERNADVIGNRQNFVGYMAMRPGVQKRGSHGLFNEKDEPIILDRVANEIANHPGNVWSHVVSLRREDAIRLGYDNSEAWRDLVKRHISDIAKAQRISLCDLKWYAAFHDTTHHPHIHLLVYSTNPKQGFLTREGIDKIRSVLTNDIFHDDLQSIYQEQTLSRDELKAVSKTEFENIIKKFQQGDFDNPQLENLIRKLNSQLQNVKGKKVYGYLPPDVKETVNNIFSELAKDDNIHQLYEKWCGLERLKYKTYTQKEKELPQLVDNKVFQPMRNMIIKAVLDMNNPAADIEVNPHDPTEQFADTNDNSPIEQPPQLDESEQSADNNVIFSDNDDLTAEDFTWSNENTVTVDIDGTTKTKYYLKWSAAYKEACKIIYDEQSKRDDFQKAEQLLLSESASGNVLAIHDLGNLYSTKKLGTKDEEKSFAYYKEALQGFMKIEPDSDFIFPHEPKYDGQIMKPVDMRSYVQYRIGKMYYCGLGTEQDYEKAFLWYQKSSSQGHSYASYSVGQMYSKGEYVTANEEAAQKYYKEALSGFLELESKNQAADNLLYKIGSMYKNGLGIEVDMDKAIDYFQRSAELGNRNAKRILALEYISGEHMEQNIEKGLAMLTECADSGDSMSCYKLGRLYFFGSEGLTKDKEKAVEWLTKSADDGNIYAQNMLSNIEQFENTMLANTIFGMFINLSRCIEEDYAQKYKSVRRTVDNKLRRMISQKKQSIGMKEDFTQSLD